MNVTEVEQDSKLQTPKSTAEYIYKHCQPYLNEIDFDIENYELYRGYTKKLNLSCATIKQSRLEDRHPRTASKILHDYLNIAFNKWYDKPWRNALYVTGSKIMAGTYGDVYTVFPIGDFEYLWNFQIKDMFLTLEQFAPDIIYADAVNEDFINSITDFAKNHIKNQYKSNDLKAAIALGSEIMVWVDRFVMINEKCKRNVLIELNKIIKENNK